MGTSSADTDLYRAFKVRRDLWSFFQQHIPVTNEQANAIGFNDCWLEGLPYPERLVGYKNSPVGVHPSYVKLILRWEKNPNFQVWLTPSGEVPAVGFVPVYERRVVGEGANKKSVRVQVNVEVNARERRRLRRALNGAQGEHTGTDDMSIMEAASQLLNQWKTREVSQYTTLQNHWLKCVSQLMLATGTDDVCDIIQIGSTYTDYRVLAICPSCKVMDFYEDALEHEVDGTDSLWAQEWYTRYCNTCTRRGFTACTTLNGANGEATNKDDVKGRKQQKKNSKGRGKKKVARSNVVVVRQARSRLTNATLPTGNFAERQYRLALMDPFNPNARGAKCTINPWQYTVPFCIRWKAILRVPAGASNFVILQPNPNFYGWTTVSNADITMMTPVLGPFLQIAQTSATGLNGAMLSNNDAAPAIASQLANFRVVAGGVNLRTVLGSNQGQTLSTAIPCLVQNSDLSWGALTTSTFNRNNSGTYWNEGQAGCNFMQEEMLGSVYNNTNILTMGGARSFTSFDLVMNEALFRFSPVTPEAFHFNDCGTEFLPFVNTAGRAMMAGDIMDYDVTSGAVDSVARRGITDVAGWSGVILRNTTTAPTSMSTYEVDYVLHIEGQPRMGGNQPPPAISNDIPAGSESSLLQYAKQFRSIAVTAIQDAGATMGRAAMRSAIDQLQTYNGSLTRSGARIL
jgi:hypothetical protein